MFKYLALFIVFLNTYSKEISFETTPSEVNVYVNKGTQRILLGKSPLKLNWADLEGKTENSNSFQITFEKDGYLKENVYITNIGTNNIFINTQLELDYNARYVSKIDSYVAKLFEAQRLVRSKNYDGAISILEEMEKQHLHFSVTYELKAGAMFLKKDFQKALSLYRRAFELNPENLEAYKMKEYLEEKLKVK